MCPYTGDGTLTAMQSFKPSDPRNLHFTEETEMEAPTMTETNHLFHYI